MVTRSKDKQPETVRKDSEADHKQFDISPVSVDSVVSADAHCSPAFGWIPAAIAAIFTMR